MKEMISERSTVVASKGQVSSDLGDEVAILDLDAGMYYGLDEAGARIWELIQEPRMVGDIRDTLVLEYDVEPDRCERDLVDLLQKLVGEGLVEVDSSASA